MELVRHNDPAWRAKSDHIAHVSLEQFGFPGLAEQLWLKKLENATYQVCCIPFRAYGMALGDIVDTTPDGATIIALKKLSGHRALRAFIPMTISGGVVEKSSSRINEAISTLGVLREWSGSRHVAVDIPPDVDPVDLVNVVQDEENAGRVVWEWADSQRFATLLSPECPTCGNEMDAHDRHVRFLLPEPVLAVSGQENAPGTWLSHSTPHESVMMQVPGAGAFVRALLPIKLEQGHAITYGVWLAIDPSKLQSVFAAWWSPEYKDLKITGFLANSIPPWGMLGSPVEAIVRDPDETPYCDRSSDPQLNRVLHDEWPHDVVLNTQAE
ncbi:DUF2199 domain-containing protein [Kibdelosporangium persicum]|uniref:DUF2199 domain-containing protein n=1 Tax=Kibdelosporangium persicum TaxID=2698649 RepID=A0ABX2FIK1_9PSEU|nr:DUF2199 domain-containing protein [Kibdelosporangium persicum]NRN71232.1 hypothetical protein [Kibdelosporangium persicum]